MKMSRCSNQIAICIYKISVQYIIYPNLSSVFLVGILTCIKTMTDLCLFLILYKVVDIVWYSIGMMVKGFVKQTQTYQAVDNVGSRHI